MPSKSFAVLALLFASLVACTSSKSAQSSDSSTPLPAYTGPTTFSDASASGTATAAPDLSAQTRDSTGPPPTLEPIPVGVKERAAAFLARGDRLYSDAQSILAPKFPRTQSEVAERIHPGTAYYDFMQADRKFQADEPNVMELPDSVARMYMNLAEFEQFAWSGVVAMSSCNRADSRLNMSVARAFIKEAHKNYNGDVNDSWSPPDIADKETGTNKCGGY